MKTIIKSLKGKINLIFASFFVILLSFAGCNNNPLTNTNTNGNGGGTGTGTGSENLKLNMVSSKNTDNPTGNIQITEAKALLSKIEVENSAGSKEIRLNPIVINFDLSGNVKDLISASIPEGIYNKIKFQLHKPEDNETVSDPEFKLGTSGHQRFSVIIKGTYNGSAFVFKSRKTINIVIDFNRPVDIRSEAKNITVLLQKNLWFLSNGIELDPRNSGNDDTIDDNIKRSFAKAFRDDDRNGSPDDN
jgi:hypothetical protein